MQINNGLTYLTDGARRKITTGKLMRRSIEVSFLSNACGRAQVTLTRRRRRRAAAQMYVTINRYW